MTKRKDIIAQQESLFLTRANRSMEFSLGKIDKTEQAGHAIVVVQAALSAHAARKYAQTVEKALRGDRPSPYAQVVLDEYADELIWLLEEYNERLLDELDRLEV